VQFYSWTVSFYYLQECKRCF